MRTRTLIFVCVVFLWVLLPGISCSGKTEVPPSAVPTKLNDPRDPIEEAAAKQKPDFDEKVRLFSACVGLTVGEIEKRAAFLKEMRSGMIQEPPFVLRGVGYYKAGLSVNLYLDPRDPMYRDTAVKEWTHERLLDSTISGIQVKGIGLHEANLGPGVPFQFRRDW